MVAFLCLMSALACARPDPSSLGAVDIVLGQSATAVEQAAAELLRTRLLGLGIRAARSEAIGTGTDGRRGTTTILLGVSDRHRPIAELMQRARIAPLTERSPGPEGFLLKMVPDPEGRTIVAAGVDERGVVYAVGELLRRIEVHPDGARFTGPLDVRTAPAFEVRGTQIGQSRVLLKQAGARKWTRAELDDAIIDIILASANTIQVDPDEDEQATLRLLRSLGIKSLLHYSVNAGTGPPEWQASESIGRTGYLCPSVPEAYQALLAKCERYFSASGPYDYVRLAAGDGGGCECDRCRPYGRIYIRLCEDLAAIIHRHHPATEVFVTNQKLDNESDLEIFRYLREQPRTWLRALCYGPGSDAMSWQPGHRRNHRLDLFRYPGTGPFGRYLQEMLHELPPEQDIVFYNEITHWRYSQNGFVQAYPRADTDGNLPPHWSHWIYERMPDRYLTMVYDRLTYFACPRYYHTVFSQLLPFGIGDCTHSSGTHDHANQWLWQRLLWNPQQSVEDVVNEYARTWFGPAAAPLMAAAIFELEKYIQDDPKVPLDQRPGVRRYYALVKEAGRRMPAQIRDRCKPWYEHMQKAAIDLHTALAVREQRRLQQRIERTVAHALKNDDGTASLRRCLAWLSGSIRTGDMERLRNEAEELARLSNERFGVRSEGVTNLDHDFIGLGWIRRQLERALAAEGATGRELLKMIVDYENPGPGGYYDNCGVAGGAPQMVHGYAFDFGQPFVPDMLVEGNRYSQKTMAYTQDEAEGVTFRYDNLDPDARYRVRFTLVRPRYQDRYAQRMNQRTQSIFADNLLLAADVEVPERMADHFTYDVPAEATRDGALTIRFARAAGVGVGDRVAVDQWRNTGGWGTIVSEVWLMKEAATER